jgi:hypothetical protein
MKQLTQGDLLLIKNALYCAAHLSRQGGHSVPADEFSNLADKISDLAPSAPPDDGLPRYRIVIDMTLPDPGKETFDVYDAYRELNVSHEVHKLVRGMFDSRYALENGRVETEQYEIK